MYKYQSLTPEQLHILRDKGTEQAFSGEFIEAKEETHGTYLCRACGLALFRESQQFTATCGWPSFDDQIEGTVKEEADADGRREEILCNRCDGHLGHVFLGEQYTAKNKRHCVNSLSIEFVESETVLDTEEIVLAAGCFWGVEHLLAQEPGVLLTEVGYSGGTFDHPTYEQVCAGNTGHLEVIRVVFDKAITRLENILKAFFECHDFEQTNGQGPDIGEQYLSAVFVFDEEQRAVANQLMAQLAKLNFTVATQVRDVATFWPAEDYHQGYYSKNGKEPYCHIRRDIGF